MHIICKYSTKLKKLTKNYTAPPIAKAHTTNCKNPGENPVVRPTYGILIYDTIIIIKICIVKPGNVDRLDTQKNKNTPIIRTAVFGPT